MTTTSKWFTYSQDQLEKAGIKTARLDCLVLLEDATGKNRAWLLTHPDFELPTAFTTVLDARVYRRAQHTPLAYIRGHAEFYGHKFKVDKRTLVPRPETEAMIEMLLTTVAQEKWQARDMQLIDVGTGSGAIAITAKLELPDSEVAGTDIDMKCLSVARGNAEALQAPVTFLHIDLLAPLGGVISPFSILLCNLPYVPDDFPVNEAAKHEPHLALYGGPDGLDCYRKLFAQITALGTRPVRVFTEALPEQHDALAGIARDAGYTLQQTNDFIQLFRRS